MLSGPTSEQSTELRLRVLKTILESQEESQKRSNYRTVSHIFLPDAGAEWWTQSGRAQAVLARMQVVAIEIQDQKIGL